MNIKLISAATLRKYFGPGYLFEVEENSTVRDLLEKYNVPVKMIMYVSANKKNVTIDYKMQDNDEIVIYPFISGGI